MLKMKNCMLDGPVEIDESMIYKTKRGINRRVQKLSFCLLYSDMFDGEL